MSTKVRDIVLKAVFAAMEKGVNPWRKPWVGAQGHPCNGISGHNYRGINAFITSIAASGRSAPAFYTLKQIKAAGGRVKDEEFKNSTPVLFAGKIDGERKDGTEYSYWTMRFYTVWNIDQVEGMELSKKMQARFKPVTVANHSPIANAEAIVAGMQNPPKINIVDGSGKAFYRPSEDSITMPHMNQFAELSEYYATLFHELSHSTGHKDRLDRQELRDAAVFGNHAYTKEELIAEMSACMLCADAGIEPTIDNSAAYIAGWHAKLKNDPDMLMQAASKAQRAADYISPRVKEEEVEEEELKAA